jgi:hypothetical protein
VMALAQTAASEGVAESAAMPAPKPVEMIVRPLPDRPLLLPEPMPGLPKLDLAEISTTPPLLLEPLVDSTPESISLPMILWPLAMGNWIIEGALKLFGPPGRMLTTPLAKNGLAACGMLMMAAAAAWVAFGQGWISLPVERFMR